ncbi:glycosyl hydrolase family 18 protein [Novispirillum itersonii]|uniref:glycosyl hydrolase family 18 protein n=1 Tax=Novispirillum itersonii TaxID=189 RepID=UPI00035E1ECC|nr:glycosyl hydrolase family 18 protein [Novispirillum itersonii]
MSETLFKGLSWKLVKTPGVDEIVLINNTDQEIKLTQLELRTNILIGQGTDQKNLTAEAIEELSDDKNYKKLMEGPDCEEKTQAITSKKEEIFRRAMAKSKFSYAPEQIRYATDIYLCPWGDLSISDSDLGYYGTSADWTKDARDEDYYKYRVTYFNYKRPASIPPRGQASLSYVSSFRYMSYDASIEGLAALPDVRVKQKGDAAARPVELVAVVTAMHGLDGPVKVVSKADTGLVGGASLPRRVLGYYANYFAYERGISIRDLPFSHLNELSYGMFSMTVDGVPASSDSWGDDWQISSLQFLRRLNPELKVNLIVGGWPKELSFDVRRVSGPPESWANMPRGGNNPDVSLYIVPATGLQPPQFYIQRWPRYDGDGSADTRPWSFYPVSTSLFGGLSFISGAKEIAVLLDSLPHTPATQWFKDIDLLTQLQLQTLLAAALNRQILPAADLFTLISRDPARRRTFARRIMTAIDTLGFDGVEIDWEYPSAADGPGYVALLEELRKQAEALYQKNLRAGTPRPRISIGIAAPASPQKIRLLDTVDPADQGLDTYWRRIGELVDTVHVMTYDYGGGWLQYSDFNAPMRPASSAPADGSEAPCGVIPTIETMLGYVNSLCLTRRQLSLGVPFYGRAVYVSSDDKDRPATTSREDWDSGINRPVLKGPAVPGQFNDSSGTYLYSHIVQEMDKGAASPAFPAFKAAPLHPKARAPSLLTSHAGKAMLVTYDNPASVREKVRYARQQGLGGVMVWDLSGDVPVDHPKSLLRAVADELRQERPALRPDTRTAGAAAGPDGQGQFSLAAQAHAALPSRRLWAAARDYGGLRAARALPQADRLLAMAPLPGGRLAVALAAGRVQCLTVDNTSKDRPWVTRMAWLINGEGTGGNATVRALLGLPSGRILALLADGRLLSLAGNADTPADTETIATGLPAGTTAALIPGWGNTALLLLGGAVYLYDPAAGAGTPAVRLLLGGGTAPAVRCAVAMPGGLLVTGGDRTAEIPTVGVWDVSGSAPVLRGSPGRADGEDWGSIAFLTALADGSVAALTAYGNYQVYGPDALAPGHMTPAWCAAARNQQAGRALLALPHGGFLSVTDNAILFWSPQADGGYTLIHRLTPPPAFFLSAAVLDDGGVVISHDTDTLLHIEARGWPRTEATLRGSWDWRYGADRASWLHHLVRAGNTAGLVQALTDGAPADLTTDTPDAPVSLIGAALLSQNADAVPLLAAAGAPLWSAPAVNRISGPVFGEALLARLLPPPLREVVPHTVPTLPDSDPHSPEPPDTDTDLDTDTDTDPALPAPPAVILPPETAAFLSDHPRLGLLMVSTLAPTLPEVARAIQHILQDYAVDDALLAVAAGDGDAALMHLPATEPGKPQDMTAREGLSPALREAVARLKGQRFADDRAFQTALDAVWTDPEKDRPWRRYERDQLISAASHPLRPEAFRLTETPEASAVALHHYGRLLDLGWPVTVKGAPVPLSTAAPVLYSQLMQAGRDALTPDSAQDPVADPQAGGRPLPPAVTNLLLAAPFIAEPLAQAADSLIAGLGQPVRQFSQAEQQANRVSLADLSAVQDPFQALTELDGGVPMAAAALYALVRDRTLSPRGDRPTRAEVLDFIARHNAVDWLPQADPTGLPQADTAWTREALSLPPDPAMLPDQPTDGASPDAVSAGRMGTLLRPPAPVTKDPVDHTKSEFRRQTQFLHEQQMKFKMQAWQNKINFDTGILKQADEELKQAAALRARVANVDLHISTIRSKLDKIDQITTQKTEPMSPKALREAGFVAPTPAGAGDNDPLPPEAFKKLLADEKIRLTDACETTVKGRDALSAEADTLTRKATATQNGRRTSDVRAARAEMREAQRKLTKMQDYAMLAEKAKYYGDKAIDWLQSKGHLSAETAEVLHKVLDISNRVVKFGTALGTIFYGLKQITAMKKGGGLGKMDMVSMGMSIAFTAVSLITEAIWGPEPDPVEEMYKALAEQMEQIQKSLGILSDQITVFSAAVDQRFDELSAQLDGMMRDLSARLDTMAQTIEAGFSVTRQEVRQSTAQVLLALQRGFDAVDRRLDLLGDRLEADVTYLQSMITAGLMTEYEEIDITIEKEETEQLTLPATDRRLSDDPLRLAEYRNRLIGGLRDKLLGLPPKALETSLPAPWLGAWPLAVGATSAAITPAMLDRIGDCYDFYIRRGTGATAQGARVYFSAPYGQKLARRFLWISEKLVPFSLTPALLAADVDALLVTPLRRLTGFLTDLPHSQDFFAALLDDYDQAVAALAAQCETVMPGDIVQGWNLPAGRLQDIPFLTGLICDDVPVLSLSDLAADTVPSNAAVRRAGQLADFDRLLTGPALGWRATRLARTLALAHALGVAALSLKEDADGGTVTLWVSFQGASLPVAQIIMLAGRVVDSDLLMPGNALPTKIARACRAVQGQAIDARNRRMIAETGPQRADLDAAVGRLCLFMGLAGLSEAGMAETLSLLWSSGRIEAYLAAQADLARSRRDGDPRRWVFSPPLPVLLRSSTETNARDRLTAALTGLAALPPQDSRRDPVPARMLADLKAVQDQAEAHLARLRSIPVPELPELAGLDGLAGLAKLPELAGA